MERTTEHISRRNQLLHTAGTLFMEKGYEAVSIQEIIDAVGVAKGTFYHYFRSKEDLLNELILTQAEQAIGQILPIIEEQDLSAAERFNRFHQSIGLWKLGKKEMIFAAARTLYRDENLIYRKKLNRKSLELMTGPYTVLIEEGNAEGSFSCSHPEDTAALLLSMAQAWGDVIVPIMLEAFENEKKKKEFYRKINAFQEAVTRILGAEEGVLNLYPPELMKEFFKNTETSTGGNHD